MVIARPATIESPEPTVVHAAISGDRASKRPSSASAIVPDSPREMTTLSAPRR